MVRKVLIMLLILVILGSCCGCLRKNTGVRVVKQISVQWVENGTAVHRVHQSPEKMHLILNKFRTLGQRFSPDLDPEALQSPTVTMTVFYSDESQRSYQIKADRYVRFGTAPWQQADPKRVNALRLLLLSLPEDLQA